MNVCNRVLKRMTLQGSIKQIPRTKDKCYLYTLNPSPIHPNSNKINHSLKIVDYFLENGYPSKYMIEPILGKYEPDIFYENKNKQRICVEIQLTPISVKKMQQKINQFVSEYGKEHDSQVLIISSLQRYENVSVPKSFQLIHKSLPKEVTY